MSRSKGLELSPKYGLNPTITTCFWCGKEKNEIALMGRVRKKETHKTAFGTTTTRATGDYEMPKNVVLDYEPCDCCRETFSKGVHLIEVTSVAKDNRPAITKYDENGLYLFPTGRSVVYEAKAAQETFKIDKSRCEAGKKLCLDEETFNLLFGNVDFI